MASTTPSNGISTSAIILGAAATVSAGLIAYAVYFDHKRRSDPEFRRNLKRQQKKVARAQEDAAKAAEKGKKDRIREMVAASIEEGLPTDPEEREAFFMQEVGEGERMVTEGSDPADAALCFYKALKVYPQPRDLMDIYDKTIAKPVFDILAEMIAIDSSISISGSSDAGSAHVE